MHYHVGVNVPGYLSEGDVGTYTTKGAAQDAAQGEAKQIREDQYYLPRSERRVGRGNKRDGYYFVRPGNNHDLGLVVFIDACQESDCLEEGPE